MSNNTKIKVLLVPEDIIRSVKDENNKTISEAFSSINNEKVFMSQSNVRYLIKHMYILHRKNEGKHNKNIFDKNVPYLMKQWALKENLNSFEGLNNFHWVLTMDYINQKFVKDNKKYFDTGIPETNVFRTKELVGNFNEFDGNTLVKKKYDEMTAEDYRTLDVYGPVKVFTQNKGVYRNENKIPVWQRSMNIRHYSKDNEGLHSCNWARASLEVPIRGYGGQPDIVGSIGQYNEPKLSNWVEF